MGNTQKNKISRKGPAESATKFSVGTKKKGNDGNIWMIIATSSGTHRWKKLDTKNKSNSKSKRKISKRWREVEKDRESAWGKNKKLEEFWGKLASGKELVLVYKNDEKETYTMPKTRKAASNKLKELDNDTNIKAILMAAQSTDGYERLYKKAKDKTPQEIIQNYKKYLINYGGNDKNWYI